MQNIVLVFWYVVGTAVINNMLKIHDNIPHIKGVIATRVKHKCSGKLKVFIAAGGGRWRCSRLSPVCPRAPTMLTQLLSAVSYCACLTQPDMRSGQCTVSAWQRPAGTPKQNVWSGFTLVSQPVSCCHAGKCRNSSGWKTEPSLNARLESLDQTGFVAGLRLVSGVFFESKRFYEGSKFQRPILYCLVSRLC